MNDLPKNIQIFLVFMVVFTLAGGAGIFFSRKKLSDANAAKAKMLSQIRRVELQGLYPNQKNLEDLQANLKEADELNSILIPEVNQTTQPFEKIGHQADKGMHPDAWKKFLFEERDRLDSLAKENKVTLGDEYFYGFGRYKLVSPNPKYTLQLGYQLVGALTLSEILFKAQINEIVSLKRTMVEDEKKGDKKKKFAVGGSEALNADILEGGKGLYKIYPFEVEFFSTPESLRMALNDIVKSNPLFVIRFISLENEKLNLPLRTEVTNTSIEEQMAKLYVIISGKERLKVRMRLDMVLWLGEKGIAEKEQQLEAASQNSDRRVRR
ncbi:MAG: hypothetical protein AAF984_00960 [Verrucomicrobiota bacterium]